MNESKRLLLIEASTREDSATHMALIKKTQYLGAEIKKYRLKDFKLPLFIDERKSQDWQKSKNIETLLDEMIWADHILLATPLYWYSVSHLMKNFIDHWSYYLRHETHPLREVLKDKSFSYLVVGSGEKSHLIDSVFMMLKQTIDYVGAKTIHEYYFSEKTVRNELQSI